MGIPGRNCIVAFAYVGCSVGRDTAELLIWWDLVEQGGSMGASPMLLLVTSIARISSVFSSIRICILRHSRRLGPPCMQAFH